uniref:Uncharacterized protein n=1 Tax=Schistocephalus solidus TaxID=70667 RepID=A0A0V0J637_SCHSO
MNSSQEDLFEDAGKSFNQIKISDVDAGFPPEEKYPAAAYESKQKYQITFCQSTLELELSVTQGTPSLAKYDILISSRENSCVQSGSLTVLLSKEENPSQFTAILLKIANPPDAHKCDSDPNEFIVSTHFLAALLGEAVHQTYLFGALDGCIYSCRVKEGLKFTRIACFPNPAEVLALAVLFDVDDEEATPTEGQSSEVIELLIGVSDSGWLLSLNFLLNQRHLQFFRLPWPPPVSATADLSCRVAGPWLHLLWRPSGRLLSLLFSLSARSTVVRCRPSPFPRHPPRPLPPLLDTASDTTQLSPILDFGIERNASQIRRAFCWRETSIEEFMRLPDGHVGALLKDGSTHRLADYCLYSLEKQEEKVGIQGIVADLGIVRAAEYNRFLNLYESSLGYLLGSERLQFVDAGITFPPLENMPSVQPGGDLDMKIEIKLVGPCDGARLVPDMDLLTPSELLFEILSASARSLRSEIDPLLLRMADLFSVRIEVHDCDAGVAFPESDNEDTPFVYSSAVLTYTEPWNASPLIQMTTTASETCAKFIRTVNFRAEHLLNLTKKNTGDRDQEVAVFLQLSPVPFRSVVDSTTTPSDHFALRVPLRRQLLRRRIGVLDWLRPLPPSQKTCFSSDSWLSIPLRLGSASAVDILWAVLQKHPMCPSKEHRVGFKAINICMQHHYTNTPVNFHLQSFESLRGKEEYSLLLSSPSTVALWSVHSALRKRLDELCHEVNVFRHGS